jgi:transposase
MIVNADHMKRVAGLKTDKKDAEWIAELWQLGLLKPSFIPSRPQRELRDLTRLRTTMSRERTRLVNRRHKTLEDTHLKLAFGAHREHGSNGAAYSGSHSSRGGRPRCVGGSGESVEQPANVMLWHWRCVGESVTSIVWCSVNCWK